MHIAPRKPKSKVKGKTAEAKSPGDTWQSKHYLLEQRLKVQLRRARGNKVLYLYTTLSLTDLPGKDVRYCIHAGMVVRYYFPMLLCN